jgi:Homeodomain-like domain-containing protein
MRTYKPRPQMDKDRRMAVAVRLTAEGLSLREVAARLSVSYMTVARDLARWEQVRASMPLAIIRLSRPAVTNRAPGAADVTAPCDTPANVTPLRRLA